MKFKRILAVIISAVMIAAYLPTTALADDHVHNGITFAPWDSASSLPASGDYYLTKDVTVTSQLSIPAGATLNLCLNGHNVTMTGTARFFYPGSGSTVSIFDDTANPGTISGGKNSLGGVINVVRNSVFNLYGGILSGNTGTNNGGTVYFQAGTTAGDAGVFNMYGGEIRGNSATSGGAIYISETTASGKKGGTLNIKGGVIASNTASGSGGAIWAGNGSTVNIDGAVISGNTVAQNASAVYITGANAKLEIKNTEIKDNKSTSGSGNVGAAVYLTSAAKGLLDGCTMTGNEGFNAGATYHGSTCALEIKDCVIKNNKINASNTTTGAVYVISNGLTLTGTNIITDNENGKGTPSNVLIQNTAGTITVKNSGVDSRVNVKYHQTPPSVIGTITGDLGGVYTWVHDTTKILDDDGTGKLVVSAPTVKALELDASAEVGVGGTVTLTWKVLPENVSNKNVTWGSSADSIATVENGVVTGVADGSAVITATTQENSIEAKCTVTVKNVSVEAVSISPENPATYVGGTVSLTAVFTPSNATNKEVTWSSDNESIAQVDAGTGVVTGVGEGSCTITVTSSDGGYTNTCSVTVGPAPVVHKHGENVYQKWDQTDSLPTATGKYYLEVDVAKAGQTIIPADADVEICLNGHTIKSSTGSRVFEVKGTLRLTDCAEASGSVKGGAASRGGAIYLDPDSKLYIENITVSGGNVTERGGAIYADKASAYLTDVTLSGNTAANGGAIYSYGAVIEITGGTISDNSATSEAGAIYLSSTAKVTLKDVTVVGNTGVNGSGITMYGGVLVLDGAQITGNNATSSYGYGVLHAAKSGSILPDITLLGAVKITGNTKRGTDVQNVYLRQHGTGEDIQYAYLKIGEEGLADGAQIGVTLDTSTVSGVKADRYHDNDGAGLFITPEGETVPDGSEGYFSADLDSYVIVKKSGRLTLRAGHSHCLYGEIDCGEHSEYGFTAWTGTSSLPTASGAYYLTADVSITSVYSTEAGADVILCLNGHSITQTEEKRIYNVTSGSTLTITDCASEAGEITGGKSVYGGAISVRRGSVFNLYAGKIHGNEAIYATGGGDEGGAIYLQTGNTDNDGGVFNMYGGEIYENTAKEGGAISINNSSDASHKPGIFNMYGGVIRDNSARESGGAIFGRTGTGSGGSAEVNIYGGEIRGNEAGGNGGAIHLKAGSVLHVSDASIINNISGGRGGGIYTESGADISINDSVISDNTASDLGGGVFVGSDAAGLVLSGDTVISGNKSESSDNNLYISAGVLIDAASLGAGARIGLSVSQAPAIVGAPGSAAGVSAFVSDSKYKTVTSKDGKLYVDADSSHKHDLCGTGSGLGCEHETLTWIAWESASSLPTETGNYYLVGDVTLTTKVVTSSGAQIKLCLNGHTVRQTTDNRIYTISTGSTLSITDCSGGSGRITGGHSTYGAAIQAQRGAVFNLYAGKINGNASRTGGDGGNEGGAIYLQSGTEEEGGGIFNMYGGQIYGNKAENGGAISAYGSKDSSHAPATVNIYGGTIKGNTAEIEGGAIFGRVGEGSGKGASVNIFGGTISKNTAGKNGGAICVQGNTTVKISGGTFSENTADQMGGAICAEKSKIKTTVSGGNFRNNTAKYGGAIFVQSLDNTLTVSGGKFTGNEALDGGAIYGSSKSTVLITGGEISRNTAKSVGGGVSLLRNTGTFKGGTISNNTADQGGGCFVRGGVAVLDGTQILNNEAEKGGGIACTVSNFTSNGETVKYPCEITIKSGKISGNKAKTVGGGMLIQGQGSVFRQTGGTVEKNVCEKAAGAFFSINIDVEIKGGTYSGNKTTKYGGGAIMLYRCSNAVFSGGSVTGNRAKTNAGGIYVQGCEAYIKGISIKNNYAEGSGGGIGVMTNVVKNETGTNTYYGKVYIMSGQISGNTGKSGGGVLITIKGSEVRMSGGTISGNKSVNGGNGGGVYVGYQTSFKMTGGRITDNRCEAGEAGGVAVFRSKATISGGTISGNFAFGSGGGIRLMGATVTINGGTISNNQARYNGGGIRAATSKDVAKGLVFISHLYISGGTISGNKCGRIENNEVVGGNGGGVLVEGMDGGSLKMTGGKIKDNYAMKSGGGIFMSIQTKLDMSGATFEGNKADNNAGGLYLLKLNATVKDCLFKDNTAGVTGGGLLATSSAELRNVYDISDTEFAFNNAKHGAGFIIQGRATANMDGIRSHGNKTTENGAAFYLSANTTINLSNSVMEENEATLIGGGGYTATSSRLFVKNTEFRSNTAGESGAGLHMKGSGIIEDSHFHNNTAVTNGGGLEVGKMYHNIGLNVTREAPYFIMKNSVLENNNAGGCGGGAYFSVGSFITVENDTFKNNISGSDGGGLWAIDDITMKSIVVTENKSGGTGAALYIGPSNYDGFAYFTGVIKMSGNMKVFGNTGLDMYLDEQAVLIVEEEGMGSDSRVELKFDSGLLTNRVWGEYGYEGSDQTYTITAGNRSLSEPMYAEPASSEENATSESEKARGEDESEPVGVWPFVAGGAAILVIAGVTIALIGKSKSKKNEDASGGDEK